MNTTQDFIYSIWIHGMNSKFSGITNQWNEFINNEMNQNVSMVVFHVVILLISMFFIIPFIFRQLRWFLGIVMQTLLFLGILFCIDYYSNGWIRRRLFQLLSNVNWENYYDLYDLYINHGGGYHHDMPKSWKNQMDYENFKRQQMDMVKKEGGYSTQSMFAVLAAFGGFVFGNRLH